MISLPRQHAACSPNVISASAAIANLLHRARMPCDSRLWDVPKIRTFAGATSHGLGGGNMCFWITVQEAIVASGWERGPQCAGTGRCSVTGQKHVYPKASASFSKFSSSRDHARPLRLSFAPAMVLTMNARRFQRTHLLSGTGSSLNASKDIDMGVPDLALKCESEPVMDAVCTAVAGSYRIGRVLYVGMLRWRHTIVTL